MIRTPGELGLVSVIIPCFNHQAYLAEAIECVLAQSTPVDQLVVVDDGSTDGSVGVVLRFGERVALVRQDHQGIGAARNAGLSIASGELIAFLDADDLWPADSLSGRLARLQAQPVVDCVFGKVEQFVSPELAGPGDGTRPSWEAPVACRLAGAMLVRRGVFDQVGWFDVGLRVGETLDWVARLTELGVPIDSVEATVLRRRIHGANTVLQQRHAQGDYLRVLKASLDRRAFARARARS